MRLHTNKVSMADPKARTLQEGRKMKREPALYQCLTAAMRGIHCPVYHCFDVNVNSTQGSESGKPIFKRIEFATNLEIGNC